MPSSRENTRALTFFPKLYFYVPPPPRRAIAGLTVTEDVAAILWMLELYTLTDVYVAQSRVRDALGFRHDRFSRLLVMLLDAGCVEYRSDLGADHRQHWVRLTDHGRTVLVSIKEERSQLIDDLLKAIPKAQRNECLAALEVLASAAWRRIQERST